MAEHITLGLWTSAAGQWLTPLAIFPLKTVPPLAQSVLDHFHIAGQPAGWIDKDILLEIVENFFVHEMNTRRADRNEPVLLIMDGHTSRISLTPEKAAMLWNGHKIIISLMPAHSSALLQPLDLSVNGEFKKVFSRRFQHIKNEPAPDRRNRLMQIAQRVLTRVNNVDCICYGWEHSGLWPFRKDLVLKSTMLTQTTANQPEVETGKKRKRGPKMNKGKVLYNGLTEHIV